MLKMVVFVLILSFTCSPEAVAAGPDLNGSVRWMVLASRQDQTDAVDLARMYGREADGVRVVRSANGWYAVVIGPFVAKSLNEAKTK